MTGIAAVYDRETRLKQLEIPAVLTECDTKKFFNNCFFCIFFLLLIVQIVSSKWFRFQLRFKAPLPRSVADMPLAAAHIRGGLPPLFNIKDT